MSQLNFSCLVPWNFHNRKGHIINLLWMFFCYYYYFFSITIYFILRDEGFRLSHAMTNLIWYQIRYLRNSNPSHISEDKYHQTVLLNNLLLFNTTLFFLLSSKDSIPSHTILCICSNQPVFVFLFCPHQTAFPLVFLFQK